MEKEKFFTYHRHGVAYKVPITPGMTNDLMRKIYKVPNTGVETVTIPEKDMTYIRFPETTCTKMTWEEWNAKGKINKEEVIK